LSNKRTRTSMDSGVKSRGHVCHSAAPTDRDHRLFSTPPLASGGRSRMSGTLRQKRHSAQAFGGAGHSSLSRGKSRTRSTDSATFYASAIGSFPWVLHARVV